MLLRLDEDGLRQGRASDGRAASHSVGPARHHVAVTHRDWHEPVRCLRAATGQATSQQRSIADAVRCPYSDEPRAVLTAVIECWLRPTLYGDSPQAATEKQLRFLSELGHTDVSPTMRRPVASAWIDHYLALRTANALETLQLEAGDQGPPGRRIRGSCIWRSRRPRRLGHRLEYRLKRPRVLPRRQRRLRMADPAQSDPPLVSDVGGRSGRLAASLLAVMLGR